MSELTSDSHRVAEVRRDTAETQIRVRIDLDGTGASTVAARPSADCSGGTSQAMASSEISSSEPLPSISAQPAGMRACRASATRSSSMRVPG